MLAVLVLLTVPLAGCLGLLGGPDEPPAPPAGNGSGSDDPLADWDPEDSSVPVPPGTTFVNGSEPHTHDYWDGRSEVTILDTDMSFNERARGAFRNTFTFHPAKGESVLPGTDTVTVTATWQADGEQVHLGYFFPGPWEVLQDAERLENGEEWVIDVNKTGWDVPHARRSLWQFRISRTWSDVTFTDVHVTIVIHRNATNLPLDPPHFDQFEGRDSRVALDESFQVSDLAPAVDEARGMAVLRVPEFGESFDPVPHDAESVVIEVTWSSAIATEPRFDLTYRSAEDVEDQQAEWDQVDGTGGTLTVHPSDRQTDSQYAHSSLWEIALWRPEDDPVQQHGPYHNLQVHVTITAYRNGAGP